MFRDRAFVPGGKKTLQVVFSRPLSALRLVGCMEVDPVFAAEETINKRWGFTPGDGGTHL